MYLKICVYLLVAFEEEVVKGLLESHQSIDHCLVYNRELVDIPRKARSNLTDKFTDTQKINGKWTPNEEARIQLDELRTNILSAFGDKNIRHYKMKVRECFSQAKNTNSAQNVENNGSQEAKDTSLYIDQFTQDFVNDIKTLIEKHKDEWDVNMGVKHSLIFAEALRHASRGLEAANDFMGREDLMNSVKIRIMEDSPKKPVVVVGDAGSGIVIEKICCFKKS